MITEHTTLILGAGASVDYGFPLGRGLITTICNQLRKPTTSLHKLLLDCGHDPDNIDQFQRQLNNSNLPSIDAFLENRTEFEEIGKLAIAGALIPAESKERLNRTGEQIGWYEYLHGKLIGRKGSFFENKLSVVTFNYDRSFEYALFLAIKNSYGLNDEECKSYVKHIPITHVYGQLGVPLWLSKEGRAYKTELTPEHARECAKSIKILHEGSMDSPELQVAQKAIKEARIVCFLGFGYHPENIRRLRLQSTLPGIKKSVYLSAFGFTDRERNKLRERALPKTIPAKCAVEFGEGNQTVLTFLRETAALESRENLD